MQHVDVYYSTRQVSNPETDSPSPHKPSQVVAVWQAMKLPIRIIEPVPLTRQQIALAHDPDYVDGILECRIANGFLGRQKDVANSLPWTTGSFLSAARGALENDQIACSPTSGFHHAWYDANWGYCTFNGLMITACVLKDEGKIARIGILDCDQHTGDGTAGIIKKLNIGWIRHITARTDYPRKAELFLQMLPEIMYGFAGCDLLLYQAGADAHIDDPLGGYLNNEQLALRDRLVFALAHEIGIPVVWNLAGGYQEPIERVLDIHNNTMAACIAEYVTPLDKKS